MKKLHKFFYFLYMQRFYFEAMTVLENYIV